MERLTALQPFMYAATLQQKAVQDESVVSKTTQLMLHEIHHVRAATSPSGGRNPLAAGLVYDRSNVSTGGATPDPFRAVSGSEGRRGTPGICMACVATSAPEGAPI